jgi:hypothetical protein
MSSFICIYSTRMPNWNSRARARSKLASIVRQCPTASVGLGHGLKSEHGIQQQQQLNNKMNKMNEDSYQKPMDAVQEQMVYTCTIMDPQINVKSH